MSDLATRYSDQIAETPFFQRRLGGAAKSLPIVGPGKPAANGRPLAAPRASASPGCAATAKPKARQPCRYKRRRERKKRDQFPEAVAFAYAMDWPLNIGLTISWDGLWTAGEHLEGHCLGRGEWERERYARIELARLCRVAHLPFVALWGRDVGALMGAHMHLAMFWPSYKLAQLVAVIERITGSSAKFVWQPYAEDTVARSACGGWQLDMNNRSDDKASALEWAAYISAQHDKHLVPPKIKGKAFGVSQAIGRTAQEAARAVLEARKKQYSWFGQEMGESP